jgi:hypothetical protein
MAIKKAQSEQRRTQHFEGYGMIRYGGRTCDAVVAISASRTIAELQQNTAEPQSQQNKTELPNSRDFHAMGLKSFIITIRQLLCNHLPDLSDVGL